LEHKITEKRLHSHDVRPPISEVEWQNEVSGYGFPGFEGDANDYFRVEIVKSESKKGVARERVRYFVPTTPTTADCSAIDTKFRLVHYMSGCALFSHKVKVPPPLE
jgi:dolichyl-phosphate-mannose-protein mannosyltransferase